MSFGSAHSPGGGSGRLGAMGTRTGPIFQAPTPSSPPTSTGSDKKSRKNRACSACKAGHLKCDHGVPSCGRCVTKRIPCYYSENPPHHQSMRPIVFVDHAFPERQGMHHPNVGPHDDLAHAEASGLHSSNPNFSAALSPSPSDYHFGATASGSSPLSATGFHTLSMNPGEPHLASGESSSSDLCVLFPQSFDLPLLAFFAPLDTPSPHFSPSIVLL